MGLSVLFSACDSESLQQEPDSDRIQFIQDWGGETPLAKDPVTLNSAVFKGDMLELSVSYSGGCGDHWFQLYSSNHITLSFPPGVSMTLVHDGNGDRCEAYITESIQFNLKNLIDGLDGPFGVHLYPASGSESIHIEYPGS